MHSRNVVWRLIGLLALISVVVSCGPAPTAAPTEPVAGETAAAEATATSVPDAEMGPVVESFQVMTNVATEDPARYEISRMAVEAWQEFGIPAELWPVQGSVMEEQAFNSKQFKVYFMNMDPRPARMEPEWWIRLHYGADAGETGMNFSGYQNPEFDALADAERVETDIDERKELVDQAQQMLYDAHPFHIYANAKLAGVYNKDTFGDPTLFMGNPIYNFWGVQTLKPLTDRKVMRVGMAKDFETINPLAANGGEDTFFLSLIYDSLCRIGLDGAPENWAAESIDAVSASEYEVTLRDGMTWHDGQPVTADDVAFTFNYFKEKEAPYFTSGLAGFDKAEVIGENQVRLTLTEPFVPFVATVMCEMPIVPKHVWESIESPLEFDNPQPIGSGPWKFDYLRPLEESMISRNADHFQPPVADGMLHVVYGSMDGLLGAMEEGSIDVMGEVINVSMVEQLRDLPHIQVEEVTSFGVYGIQFNTRFEPFSDRYFRQAMAYTMPIDQIIEVALQGAADPGGSVIAPALKFWHNDDLPAWPYDLEKARSILLEAGYTWDSEGKLHYPAADSDNRLIDSGPQLY